MLYSDFQGDKLSKLGFGAMRLPVLDSGAIDVEQVEAMVDLALEKGLNYFDTAYPYHGGMSERVLGRALSRHPRESYRLADKFPGHQIAESYDPATLFEEQLQKCGVEYFDFYLLHNICELSLPVYEDERWGIVDYFVEQRRQGRIRHLGFSAHGGLDNMRRFLDKYGAEMEFCQIQLNYLDWTLQRAKEKCALLAEYDMPIWVMEPVRGGKLANLGEKNAAKLQGYRPEESQAAWALRWLLEIDNVKVILSGMSNMEQLRDNLNTFSSGKPLSAEEVALLADIAEDLKDSVPCTGCRYCTEGCPVQLDIPTLLQHYNEARLAVTLGVTMAIDGLPEEKRPSACVGCGACAHVCPQQIDIPGALADFNERLAGVPHWKEICKEREEANKRSQEAKS